MISAPISLTATEARCGPYGRLGGRRNMHTGVWMKSLKERELLENLGAVGRIVLIWTSRKRGGRSWTGLTF
jgi:hypothetical protein